MDFSAELQPEGHDERANNDGEGTGDGDGIGDPVVNQASSNLTPGNRIPTKETTYTLLNLRKRKTKKALSVDKEDSFL